MKQKTAAVYDRWLYTLGGGEQVAFGYAQMLRDLGYRTEILTHTPIDIHKAEIKLSVDLKNIQIRYLPILATEQISPLTEKYDVFINTSYLDYFPSRAKIGLLSVFFPGKIYISPLEYFKRAFALPSLRNFFIYPASLEGFSYGHHHRGQVFTWLSNHCSIRFNKSIEDLSLGFYLPEVALSIIDSLKFKLDGKRIYPISRRVDHHKNILKVRFNQHIHSGDRLEIIIEEIDAERKIALASVTIWNYRYWLYNYFKKFFPVWELRLHGGPGVTKRTDIMTYDEIITISQFSRMWISKYWGLESQILYPTTNTSKFHSSSKKKNRIIHVGRFFVSGHCKKQLDLARAFSKLVSSHGIQGWELHFVGSIHEGEQHQAYFNQVKEAANGYPVFFHTDVSNNELKELLSTSKIYWHATGLDENEETQPILFEHFGITTVEAMASGCVPVVINAGGQKEIVTSESGFLWNSREQLIKETLNLIEDEVLLKKYSGSALERSKYFDVKSGKKRFAELIRKAEKRK